jgi:hypothetical protein
MANPAWKSIADAAPTLDDLKQLSFERQVMLLLARLNVLYSQMANTGGLHRENLKLDGYDLAIGYGPSDKKAVIEYLLGRPWMELVHRGYLLETSPNFYRVSEDGVAVLNNTTIRLISRSALEAVKLLHPDLAEAERDFREGRFEDAVRDAFRVYENRINAMRDASSIRAYTEKVVQNWRTPWSNRQHFVFRLRVLRLPILPHWRDTKKPFAICTLAHWD